MASSKAARIWKRTWVGSSLVGAVTLLVWWSDGAGGERVTLVAGGLLAAVGLIEVHRTGVFGARALALGVLPALAGVCTLLALVFDGRIAAFGFGGGPPGLPWTLGATLLAALLLAPLAWLLLPYYRRHLAGRSVPAWGPFALALWLALPLPWLSLVRLHWGTRGLVALLLLSKVGDIAGYYIGSALGRSHPFPNLSPGKTTAGCVGSFVAGTLAGLLCQLGGLLPSAPLGLLAGLLAGALVNVAAQAADLLESLFKRRAGVKDSGTVFGPTGGVLDAVDSLLLSVPVALLTWAPLFDGP